MRDLKKTKTTLRSVGFALFIFPEPTLISNVVGLAMIGASCMMPGDEKYFTYRQAREMVNSNVADTRTRLAEGRPPVQSIIPWGAEHSKFRVVPETEPVKHHVLNTCLIDNYKSMDKAAIEPEEKVTVHHTLNKRVIENYRSAEKADKEPLEEITVHHKLDRKRLFEMAAAMSEKSCNEQAEEKTEYHVLNTGLVLQYRSEHPEQVAEEKVVHHTINRKPIDEYRARIQIKPALNSARRFDYALA